MNDSEDRGTLSKKKDLKCKINECFDKVSKMIGSCTYCQLSFCAKHRLPEAHSCQNLQTCRQESHQKNSSKLLNEKCVADKI
jgi:large subunit ribosomal protein L40e